MATIKRLRLRASSLVEVTVAVTILVLVFGLALMSFANLARTGPSITRLRAEQLTQQLAAETLRTHLWLNQATERGGFTLTQTITPFPSNPELIELEITARIGERDYSRYRQLVYAPKLPTP